MVTAWWACTDVDGAGHGNFGDVLTPQILRIVFSTHLLKTKLNELLTTR